MITRIFHTTSEQALNNYADRTILMLAMFFLQCCAMCKTEVAQVVHGAWKELNLIKQCS